MVRSKIDKEKIAAINQLSPLPEQTKLLSDSTIYKDEAIKNGINSTASNCEFDYTPILTQPIDVGSIEKKPRYNENTQPNPQKCKYSPFAYHRFTRSHKEKTKDGNVIMVLRCRYCLEMQQVIISFRLVDGRYVATKQTISVEEANG